MTKDEMQRRIDDIEKRLQQLEMAAQRKADTTKNVRPSAAPHYRTLGEYLGPYAPMDDDATAAKTTMHSAHAADRPCPPFGDL